MILYIVCPIPGPRIGISTPRTWRTHEWYSNKRSETWIAARLEGRNIVHFGWNCAAHRNALAVVTMEERRRLTMPGLWAMPALGW
jgi:hypothetical protein